MTSSIISCYSQPVYCASICCYISLVPKTFFFLPASSQRKLKEKMGASFRHANKYIIVVFHLVGPKLREVSMLILLNEFHANLTRLFQISLEDKNQSLISTEEIIYLEQGSLNIWRRLNVNSIFKAEYTTAQESTKFSHCHFTC